MSNKAKANRQRSMERSGSTERSSSVEKGSLSRQGSTEKPPKEPDEGITEDLDPTELKVRKEGDGFSMSRGMFVQCAS